MIPEFSQTPPPLQTNNVGRLSRLSVRDPRGCGQNFYYDVGGRLLAEDYVSCAEAHSDVAEAPAEEVPSGAIALGPIASTYYADVLYSYDAYPDWITPPVGSGVLGRATGVADRGQRSAVAYDDRGNAIWTARQMAVISAAIMGDEDAELPDGRPTFDEDAASAGNVTYDETAGHTYVRTASFDHAARPTEMTLPADPDWDPVGMDLSPEIRGNLEYDRRSLPARALLTVGELDPIPVVAAIEYLRDGLVSHIEYGDLGSAPVVESDTEYDVRRRPTRMTSTRTPSPGVGMNELGEVSVIHDQRLEWDTASNLTALVDERLPSEWPEHFRPQTVEITHDSLYRVVGALFHYSTEEGDDEDDLASDWRDNASAPNSVDPMRPNPADMVGSPSGGNRVRSLVWEWDWLGNMTEWTDDAQQFYERSIGEITNGQDIAARPSALYVTSNLEVVGNGGGWVEVDYGVGGNVTQLTVHGECTSGSNPEEHGAGRVEDLSGNWVCDTEQHFEYRWDELNRIVEARRWDRTGGYSSVVGWTFEARQRYRYDGANQRTVKESFDTSIGDSRVALYVYPGDFERRGVLRGSMAYETPSTGYDTETQYLVAGARLVWNHAPISSPGGLDRNRRLTVGVTDLIQTTAATVDLLSGELLEVSTYYPNGARETLRTNAGAAVPLEPMGFTGKEADEDVGLVYFGERYLLARLGRWASADPLHVHASGGGEALNSYHYVSGNLVQARDPFGLDAGEEVAAALETVQSEVDSRGATYDAAPGSGSGTALHAEIDGALRAGGDLPESVRRRIVTEAVITPDGTIVAHGEDGGPSAVSRLRSDEDFVERVHAESHGRWTYRNGAGERRIRRGHFRTVDVLVITESADADIQAVRAGTRSARGSVLAIDVKFGRARLSGTAGLRRRLGVTQVAARPGGSLISTLSAMADSLGVARRLTRAGRWILDNIGDILRIAGMVGIVFEVADLAEIPRTATAVGHHIAAIRAAEYEQMDQAIADAYEFSGVYARCRGVARCDGSDALRSSSPYGSMSDGDPSDTTLDAADE